MKLEGEHLEGKDKSLHFGSLENRCGVRFGGFAAFCALRSLLVGVLSHPFKKPDIQLLQGDDACL